MALYQLYTFTNTDQLISDLRDFASANGWTIDFFGTYNSHNRLHFHKGSAHFECWYYMVSSAYINGCTGYSSGSTPTAQPTPSSSLQIDYLPYSYTGSAQYCFVSTGDAIYVGRQRNTSTLNWDWACFCESIDKRDMVWTGGQYVSGTHTAPMPFGPYGSKSSMLVNGAWTPTSGDGSVGQVSGSVADTTLALKQPLINNGSIVPIPVKVYVRNATTSTLLHPAGYAPGFYRCDGGDIYAVGETIPVDADTYLIMPCGGASIGGSYGDILFKLS